MQNHYWEATHGALQSALLVKSIDPALVLKNVVSNTHRDTADQVDSSIGQILKRCVTCLHSENLTELLHNLLAQRVFLLHGSCYNIVRVDFIGSFSSLTSLQNKLIIRVFFL